MRIWAVALRILRQLGHDWRTMALMVLSPIFVMTLMSLIFNSEEYNPRIGIVNAPASFVERLEEKDAVLFRYDAYGAEMALAKDLVDGVVDFSNGLPTLEMEGSDPGKSMAVQRLVEAVLREPPRSIARPPLLEVTYLHGYKDMAAFDSFGPILIGFYVFFFVFLIAGVSFIGERNNGTLERILATPLRRWEVVAGYILGFGFFAVLQSGLIAWYSIRVLGIFMVGSFPLVLAVTSLTAMVGLAIGTFISAFADNELQMIQFVPVVIVPQLFFSGLFDLGTMPKPLQMAGRGMPLWYVADALRNIMIRGTGFEEILLHMGVLAATCLLFATANVLALKKYRRL
ncbi:ABC transporter permease [Anaerotalea alkaliphila]|uniref:ABC transporter permease n=1 Tax=Anaerotalea alkaliphila TaxID=2662126 RepID=A0A7X5HVJ9_9FIRM|nr:ABC transporter permease [Anaerotalea alkaliphila]NDL67467.1 ABC transporter permease [Anaerotalea alkaliphila]